jgi:hypothetical protein
MADAEEDMSHLRAPDPADYDPTEEAQDFLKLDKFTYALRMSTFYIADTIAQRTRYRASHTTKARRKGF